MNKDVRKLVVALERIDGVEVERSGSGHLRVLKSGVMVTTLPTSPSDHRWRQNALADLGRVGITPATSKEKLSRPPRTMPIRELRTQLTQLRDRRKLSEFARFAQQLGEIRGMRTFASVDSAVGTLGLVIQGHGLRDWGWQLTSTALAEWNRRQPEQQEVVQRIAESVDPPVELPAAAGVKLVIDLSRLAGKLAEFGIELEVQ